MKIAFHFDELKLAGGSKAIIATLKAVRAADKFARSKMFVGTLLFSHAASKTTRQGNQATSVVDQDFYKSLIEEWASPQPLRWYSLRPNALQVALEGSVFAVCLETLDLRTGTAVNTALQKMFGDAYLGATEVDESLVSHLGAYQLVPGGRIDCERATVFWDGINEDSKMHFELDWYNDAGFETVAFESLEGRYTIFDRDDGLEQAKRTAESRQWMRQLLDSVFDHVIPQLADGAPDIPDKLWGALKALRSMEINDEASNVALGCRRVFESAADALFPPTDDAPDGRQLGTDKYKNRLLKYLETQRVGETEQKLIVAAMEAAAAELDSLNDLANKGVHADIDRTQARRCLLRTLLFLDDLIAVRKDPLEIQIRFDAELMRKMAES